MILAAAASQDGSITIPLGVLLLVGASVFSSVTAFAIWLVKQITLQNRLQAETSVILKGMAERNIEDRARITRLEENQRIYRPKERDPL